MVDEGDGRETSEWARRVAARRGARVRRRDRIDLEPHDWGRGVLRVEGGDLGGFDSISRIFEELWRHHACGRSSMKAYAKYGDAMMNDLRALGQLSAPRPGLYARLSREELDR